MGKTDLTLGFVLFERGGGRPTLCYRLWGGERSCSISPRRKKLLWRIGGNTEGRALLLIAATRERDS